MTIYSEFQALADELLGSDEFGTTLTVTGVPTAGDPVTGAGASAGVSRSIQGVITKVDFNVFPETVAQSTDKMLISSDSLERGERFGDMTIVQVMKIEPDNATGILWKALIRG